MKEREEIITKGIMSVRIYPEEIISYLVNNEYINFQFRPSGYSFKFIIHTRKSGVYTNDSTNLLHFDDYHFKTNIAPELVSMRTKIPEKNIEILSLDQNNYRIDIYFRERKEK